MIQINIQEPYKSLILSGVKTIEGRINKGKFSILQVGDLLQLDDTGDILEVVKLAHYTDFKTMLEQEGINHILPGMSSIEAGIAVYHHFYTPAQEAEFGVIAIEIRKKE